MQFENVVTANFARTLERELFDTEASRQNYIKEFHAQERENDRLRAQLEVIREWGGRCQREMEYQARLVMDANIGTEGRGDKSADEDRSTRTGSFVKPFKM